MEVQRFTQLFSKTDFDFIGKRFLAFFISGMIVLGSIILLLTRGPNYGIEFVGGTLVQVSFQKPAALSEVRKALFDAGHQGIEIQSVVGSHSFILRAKGKEKAISDLAASITTSLKSTFKDNPPTLERREFIGPVIGRHLYKQTVFAIVFSLLGIIAYVAFRFKDPVWGVCAVIALAHDVLATLGLFMLTGKEVDLLIVAALLTIAGYSVNDTIVVFDRMRERMRIFRKEGVKKVINTAINETLSRTVVTTLTTEMAVIALFLFGGEVIHDFALALIFGGIIGTYSTIAVAAPLVYAWQER